MRVFVPKNKYKMRIFFAIMNLTNAITAIINWG